jgi:hypothetical protein
MASQPTSPLAVGQVPEITFATFSGSDHPRPCPCECPISIVGQADRSLGYV